MMYRSDWATKPGQERILAFRIKISGFREIISTGINSADSCSSSDLIRIQWHPDHTPDGSKIPNKKVIQIGMRGEMMLKFSKEFIISVEDITEFVRENQKFLSDLTKMRIPIEREFQLN